MEKKYVVRDFGTQVYWCGEQLWWSDEHPHLVHLFNSMDEAESFVSKQSGMSVIETVYRND
jgi:hypothetical protein